MQDRKNTTDSMFDARIMNNRTDRRLHGAQTCVASFGTFGWIWVVTISAAVLLSAGSALGQYGSFTVSPMKVEAKITPGKDLNTVLNIQNLDPNSTYTIELSLVELTQSESGEWMTVDSNAINDPNAAEYQFDLRRLSSCRTWIRLRSNVVTLEPSQMAPLEVSIHVERGKRGFHTAGILATVQPRPGAGPLPVSVRFLVPVVVEIETRPLRPKVEATAVGMKFIANSAVREATTFVTMEVHNNGGTLSELKPLARIYAYSKNHWHLVTTTAFDDIRIIPGAILKLQADALRSLPSGKYKVQGELYVDGRRTKSVENIIDFEGDPTINRVSADAPLDLNPLDLTIECIPGSLRAETITVYNASDDTITIQTAKALQSWLKQVTGSGVKGVDLDCTDWLQVTPETFTLRGGGGRQNVKVVAKLPAGAMQPCYYSLLALWATYPDGQRAGYKTTNIFVKNSNMTTEPEARGLSVVPQELGESKYLITTKFSNLKSVHFKPLSVKAGVIPTEGLGAGTVPRLSTYLSGDPRPMLPFETRTFSGDLDFSRIPAGRYVLTGRLEFAPGRVALAQRMIDITVQGDRRTIETVGTHAELGETVEVHW